MANLLRINIAITVFLICSNAVVKAIVNAYCQTVYVIAFYNGFRFAEYYFEFIPSIMIIVSSQEAVFTDYLRFSRPEMI